MTIPVPITLFLLAGATLFAIVMWVRQRERAMSETAANPVLTDGGHDGDKSTNAVVVTSEHGQLIHVNGRLRQWMNMNGDEPDLEEIIQATQPADNFIQLLRSEAHASFQMGHRWVEATSHRVPAPDGQRMVVVMREMHGNQNGNGARAQAAAADAGMMDVSLAMQVINNIGETVNASMGMETALQVLLEIINRALPSDAGEIAIWDDARNYLQQRGWIGNTRYLLSISMRGGGYEPGEGIAGWMAETRRPLLLSGEGDLNTKLLIKNSEYDSAVGIPLELGEKFVGTLTLFSNTKRRYTSEDVAFLQAISKAVATAIHNAELYAIQEERIKDIASLQQIAEQPKSEGETKPIYLLLTERMANLMDADMCGVFLFEADRDVLVPQLPFYGLPDHVAGSITIPLTKGTIPRDIWENKNQPFWVSNDVEDEPLVEELDMQGFVNLAGIKNTALFPLQIAGERFGIMAISNKRTTGGFTPSDLQNLRVLSSQAAIVVENVRLYQRERRIDTELMGLQEMTHAIGALTHEEGFFGEITERIARLMESEMCGVLIYSEAEDALISQPPFYGVPDDIAADYKIEMPPGSVQVQMWDEEEYWLSNRVMTDPLVFAAKLDAFAERLGVMKTLIAPMAAGGRRIGIVQVSNKVDGSDFSDKDARFLRIFAAQAASIIENQRLYREVQVRATQATSLRRIAELSSSIMTTSDSFEPVLAEIATLADAEITFINVIDHNTNALITYPRWVYGHDLDEPLVQDLSVAGYDQIPARSGEHFISNNVPEDNNLLPGYQRIARRFAMRNTLIVPLAVGERMLGELGLANRRRGRRFVDEDVATFSTVAAQIASSVERLLLFEVTGENLRRRVEELDAIARISNELTLTHDLSTVLQTIREEAIKATYADEATISILRPADEWRVPGKPEVLQRIGTLNGDLLQIADIEIEAIQREVESVLVTDYENSEMAALPQTARSAVAVAFMYLDEVVGVMQIYSSNVSAFDERAAGFLMTLSSKAALAYQNAQLFAEQEKRGERLRQRADQLQRIFELGQMVQTNADPVMVLEAIGYSIQQSVGFDTVLMLMDTNDNGVYERVAHAGMPLVDFDNTRDLFITAEQLEELLVDEYREGADSYFFPISEFQAWYSEEVRALSASYDSQRSLDPRSKEYWHDGDMLIIRVNGQNGDTIGLFSLDRPHNNLRPDRQMLDVLEIFAHQASTMIENTRLFIESRRSAEQEAQINDMLEAISGTLDLSEIAEALGSGVREFVPFDQMHLVLNNETDAIFDYLAVNIRENGLLNVTETQTRTLEKMALGRSYEDREEYYYNASDAQMIEHYMDLQEWYESGEQSTLVLPLVAGGIALGALHFGSKTPGELAKREHRSLLSRLVQLVASTMQNARLFNQAVTLQVLNRSVVESIQQGIVVLDEEGHILSINEFMRNNYGWDEGQARHKYLFEYRPELASVLRDDLTIVLNEGVPRDYLGQTSPLSDGHVMVRNFYMYPLRSRDTVQGAVLLVEDVTDRAELEKAIESRANQLAALTEVSTRITASLEREEVVELAMEEMIYIIPFSAMTMWRRNGSYMVLEGVSGLDIDLEAESIRIRINEDNRIQQLVDSQRVVAFSDDEMLPDNGLPGEAGIYSWMGVPLVNQGHVVGMFILTKNEPDHFETRQEQHVAFAFASQVAIALANADLFEQTFERTNELGTLLEAAQATSLTRNLNELFRIVAELMFSALEMDDAVIMRWDEVDNEMVVQYSINSRGDEEGLVPIGTRYQLSDYPARAQANKEREVIVVVDSDDPQREQPFPLELEDMRGFGHGARLLVPLVVRDQPIGMIQLGQASNDEESVTQQKVRLARALGAQVAVQIDNARLNSEITSRFEELLTINQLSQSIASTLKLEDMLPIIKSQVLQVTNAEELYLALYNAQEEKITFPLAVTSEGEEFVIPERKLGDDEVSYIIQRKHSLSLEDKYFTIDEFRKSMGISNGEGGIKAYLGVPLKSGNDVLGVLAIRDRISGRAFTLNDERILTTVGAQLGAAIQNVRLFEQLQSAKLNLESIVDERTEELEEERDRLDTLYQITSELARTLDMEQLLERSLGMVSKAVGADDGVIMISDPATDELYSRAWINPYNLIERDDEMVTHPAVGLARWLIYNEDNYDQVVLVDDLNEMDYWDETGRETGLRSALAVMLESNEDPLGVMVLLAKDPFSFTENHLKLLVPAANQVAASINSADLYQLIRDQAEKMGKLLRTEQEEAKKTSAILESIADGVMLADSNGEIVLFNSAAERILELPRDQALGQPVSKLAGLYGASAATWTELVDNWSENAEDIELDEDDSVVRRIEIGSKIISTQLSPVSIGDLFLGTVSVFRDITKDVEADRAKTQFIANVSHEFRTPLTPIKGYTDLLLMNAGGDLNEMQLQMIKTIKENAERLAILVNDVLNISKLDSGEDEMHFTPVDLVDVIQTVFRQVASRSTNVEKEMVTSLEFGEDMPKVRADREKLSQVLANIVDNAFNYTPAGGSITVSAARERDNDSVLITIADSGVGIPEEFREAAWRRFERYDQHAVELDIAGTGLGLSLAQDLVRLHNGEIWFESELGEGTTFYIRLPIEQPHFRAATREIPHIDTETLAGD